jgi:hypothetical protein
VGVGWGCDSTVGVEVGAPGVASALGEGSGVKVGKKGVIIDPRAIALVGARASSAVSS